MEISSTNKLLLNSREASDALGVSERTLTGLAQSGALPAIRIGRSIRYAIDDLRRFVERSKSRQQQVADLISQAERLGLSLTTASEMKSADDEEARAVTTPSNRLRPESEVGND